MDSLYILIPVTVLLLGVAVAAYLWSVDSGQFDDLDKAARSILFDEEQTPHTPDDDSDEHGPRN
jgi:cbb3-type cytochrome oxidase maturation protein